MNTGIVLHYIKTWKTVKLRNIVTELLSTDHSVATTGPRFRLSSTRGDWTPVYPLVAETGAEEATVVGQTRNPQGISQICLRLS